MVYSPWTGWRKHVLDGFATMLTHQTWAENPSHIQTTSFEIFFGFRKRQFLAFFPFRTRTGSDPTYENQHNSVASRSIHFLFSLHLIRCHHVERTENHTWIGSDGTEKQTFRHSCTSTVADLVGSGSLWLEFVCNWYSFLQNTALGLPALNRVAETRSRYVCDYVNATDLGLRIVRKF